MACCGGTRTGRTQHVMRRDGEVTDRARPVAFSYLGSAILNVVGGATGRQYRFAGHGATLAVDARDAIGLAGVPLLRRS